MKYGFIGCGNMANAIISGIIESGIAGKEDIIGSAPSEASRERARIRNGIEVTRDNREAAQADMVFLCVKPQMLPLIAAEIKDEVKDKPVVSIAAGKKLSDLADMFEMTDARFIRVMPNTPAMVGEAMSAICASASVSDQELEEVIRVFSALGKAEIVPEKLFDAVVGVSGSSPAYVYLFIEALADGAVECGMPRKQAYAFAAQAVLGSAKMVLETGLHPGELKDMVCSPGGTTIEGVRVLEDKGFRSAIIECVKACADKSKML